MRKHKEKQEILIRVNWVWVLRKCAKGENIYSWVLSFYVVLDPSTQLSRMVVLGIVE